jgi:hypothetical protein
VAFSIMIWYLEEPLPKGAQGKPRLHASLDLTWCSED